MKTYNINNVRCQTVISKTQGELIKVTFADENDNDIYNHYLSLSSNSGFFNELSFNILKSLFDDKEEFYSVIKRIGRESKDIVNFINTHGYVYLRHIESIVLDTNVKFPSLKSIKFA